MLKFGNKEFNNLQEQVLENANEILAIKQSLGSALPDPIEGPQGPVGPQGPQGPVGERGNKWTVSSELPAAALIGDIHLMFNGDVYQYTNQGWVLRATIKGPQGPQGNTGPRGIEGPVGPEGPQGPQGTTAPIYEVVGTLNSIEELPDPSLVQSNQAYLIAGSIYGIVGGEWEEITSTLLVNQAQNISFYDVSGQIRAENVRSAIQEVYAKAFPAMQLAEDFDRDATTLYPLKDMDFDNTHKLKGVPNPLEATEAANKGYVDENIIDIKNILYGTILAVEPQTYTNVGSAVIDRANGYPIVSNQKAQLKSVKGVSTVAENEIVNTDIHEIKVYGYNLFDGELEQGSLSGVNGQPTVSTEVVRSVNFTEVIGGVSYKISQEDNIPTAGDYWKGIYEYDKNQTFIQRTLVYSSSDNFKNATITLNAETKYIKIAYKKGTANVYDVCFHNASVDLGYKPYVAPQTIAITANLKGIGTAQDEITETQTKTVIGMIDLGTPDWVYSSTTKRFSTFLSGAKPTINNDTIANILSPIYQKGSYITTLTVDKTIALDLSGYLYVKDERYTDVTTFKQAMVGIPFQYEIAEPTITNVGFGEVLFNVQRGGTIATDSNGDLTLNHVVYKPVE